MTTNRQASANARNAQKSTGPRSEAGRSKSAQNARRHGLSAAAAEDTEAEAILADLVADFPKSFVEGNLAILEILASTQARLNRAAEHEAVAVQQIACHAQNFGASAVNRAEYHAQAQTCMGKALATGDGSVGPYSAADFRYMAGVFSRAARFEPDCLRTLEDLRKLSRYTRDGEALRRKLIKALAEAARDIAPDLD